MLSEAFADTVLGDEAAEAFFPEGGAAGGLVLMPWAGVSRPRQGCGVFHAAAHTASKDGGRLKENAIAGGPNKTVNVYMKKIVI